MPRRTRMVCLALALSALAHSACEKDRFFGDRIDAGAVSGDGGVAGSAGAQREQPKSDDAPQAPTDSGDQHGDEKSVTADEPGASDEDAKEANSDPGDDDKPLDGGDDSGPTEEDDLLSENQPQCVEGEHACPALGCVPDDDSDTCGVSCTPCDAPAGGLVACDGTRCVPFCPDDQQLCSGACIDAAAPCDSACPEGTRACDGICASDEDPNHCGEECLPCAVPAGAEGATCDDGVCDFTCPGGTHRCDGFCAENDDPTACGPECAVCPTDPNGDATCSGGTCALECRNGFHECGGKCVANDSTEQCGAACNACATPGGGSVACVNGQCQGSCPPGSQLCAGTCIASNASCDGSCAAGTHDCNGTCLADDSPDSCGDSCTPCPDPGPGGEAACSSGRCEIDCSPGFHRCGDDCVSNGDVGHCGPSSCDACEAPAGGSVSCDGTSCQPSCPGSDHLCDDECLDLTTACGSSCPTGRHECEGRCFSNAFGASCDALSWSGTFDFGTGDSAVSRTFTLTNAAPFAASGLSVTLSPSTAGGCSASTAVWEITADTCSTSLAAEDDCAVTVEFDPTGAAADCYAASLEADAGGYSATLSLTGEAEPSGPTWQILMNSNTFTNDPNAPEVGSPCSTPGEVRDARPTEVSYTRQFTLVFTTDPPTQGSCAAGEYAVESCEYYQGDSCSQLELKPGACGLSCFDQNVEDPACQLIYREIVCQ